MNHLVPCLYSDIGKKIQETIPKSFVDPVGGWEEWQYDVQKPWKTFLSSRNSIHEFLNLSSLGHYAEIGFASIPYLHECPSNYNITAITEHPFIWLKKAKKLGAFQEKGCGLSTGVPKEDDDYLKLWVYFTNLILTYSQNFYRYEDISENQVDILCGGPAKQINQKIPLSGTSWNIVSNLAESIGYFENDIRPYRKPLLHSVVPYNPKVQVSIIIAAYNNGGFLSDAISSALNQSGCSVEVIYVDDGSTDDSLLIANSFENVKVISQENMGVCSARNSGTSHAVADWLLFLDGDDILPSNYVIEKLVGVEKNPSASIIYSESQNFGSSNKYNTVPLNFDPDELWYGNFINTSSLFRHDAFKAAGMWRENYGSAWDWALALRIVQNGGTTARYGCSLLYRHHSSAHCYVNSLDNIHEQYRLKYLQRVVSTRKKITTVVKDSHSFHSWISNLSASIQYHLNQFSLEKPYGLHGKCVDVPPDIEIICSGPLALISESLDSFRSSFSSISIHNSSSLPASSLHELIWKLDSDLLPSENCYHEMMKSMFMQESISFSVSCMEGCSLIFNPFWKSENHHKHYHPYDKGTLIRNDLHCKKI